MLLGMLEETDACGCDAVARGVLDEVHGFVGEVQEFCFSSRVGGVGGDADAGGDLHVEARLLQPDGFANQDVQAAREHGVWPLVVAEPLRVRPTPAGPSEAPLFVEHRDDLPDKLVEEVARGRAVLLLGDVLDSAAVSRTALAQELSRQAGLECPDLLLAGTRIQRERRREALVRTVRGLLASGARAPTGPPVGPRIIKSPSRSVS